MFDFDAVNHRRNMFPFFTVCAVDRPSSREEAERPGTKIIAAFILLLFSISGRGVRHLQDLRRQPAEIARGNAPDSHGRRNVFPRLSFRSSRCFVNASECFFASSTRYAIFLLIRKVNDVPRCVSFTFVFCSSSSRRRARIDPRPRAR